MKTKIKLFFLLFLTLLTGCWDRIEIEQRGFIIGAGIDLSKEGESDQQLVLTQQLIVPSGLKGGNSGQGGEAEEKSFYNLTQQGDSLFQIVRGVATNSSRTPFYSHVQVIVLSQELTRSDMFSESLDFFIRNNKMRRNAIVLVAFNDAKDILGINAKNEKTPTDYIRSISENSFKNAEILPKARLGDIHESLLQKRGFAITMIEKKEEKLDLSGIAIVDGEKNKMVGILDREGTVGLNFIRDEIEGGYIKTKYNEKFLLYDIFRSQTDVKIDGTSKDDLSFTIEVETEGALAETFLARDYLKQKTLTEFEQSIQQEIKSKVDAVIKKAQEEFKTDFLDLGEKLRQSKPDIWKEVKDGWTSGESHFTKAEIKVEVKVIVRSTGSVIQTTKE